MGAYTTNTQVWYPDISDTAKLNTLLATMASSIENGIGPRLNKLETFVGCRVSNPSAQTIPSTLAITSIPMTVNQAMDFTSGMTANAGGTITVTIPGMYTIMLNANFLPSTNAAPRINTYLYKNSDSLGFSSTYGEASTVRYANCNVVTVAKLEVGDVISTRASVGDNPAVAQTGNGFNMSMALTSRS